MSEYRPRLAAELRQDQHLRLTTIIPRGMQKPLFQALVDGVLELYDKGGIEALGMIVGKYIDTTQIAKIGLAYTKKVHEDGDNRTP